EGPLRPWAKVPRYARDDSEPVQATIIPGTSARNSELSDRPEIKLTCLLRNFACFAVGDQAAIDLRHGRDATQGAGHESLVGRIDLRQGEVAFARDVARLAPGLDHIGLGDALEAVEAGRGPDLAAAH